MSLVSWGTPPVAVRAEHVLGGELAERVYRATLAERKWLVDASTGGRDGHRSAQLLYTPIDEAALVSDWMDAHLAELCRALGIDTFTPRKREMQLTVHGDGDFYKVHTDDQGRDVAARALSYLYYFHREPKAYEGGALAIHAAETFTIEPHHDSVVVFPSYLPHEVLPVRVPSGDLADGRFTINGWLWR